MEDLHSVSSPRRILCLSKKKRATVSFLDGHDKAPGFGLSGVHGSKPSEVYGFVGSITTVVATDSWLHSIGIFYYPNRYWAVAIPAYVMVSVTLALGFYIGLNFLSTSPPTSFNMMFDEFSRGASSFTSSEEDEMPIQPIYDIGVDKINELMFNSVE